MSPKNNMGKTSFVWVPLATMVRKEADRFLRLWSQTLLPSVITSVLYFVIFGSFIGSQIPPINGVSYMQFIVPGLVMMALVTNSFSNTVTSFFFSKFQKSIEEILVSPMPVWVMLLGFTMGGILRGVLVGLLVLIVSLFFTHIAVAHLFLGVIFMILSATLFSLAGLLNGIFAKNFDQVSIVPTFVLTPLVYLGGIFYSIQALSPFWQTVSKFNPVLYIINGFRYSFLGFSDVSIVASFAVLIGVTILFAVLNFYLLTTGKGIRQ